MPGIHQPQPAAFCTVASPQRRPGRPPTRTAFTLIEILTIIAVIGVLVALLLPAVQSTREKARRTSCANNLLQMHLAVEAYNSQFNRYPAGTVTDRLPARLYPDGLDYSWVTQIRSLLDGGTAFAERFDWDYSVYHPRNWPLAAMQGANMSCPSNPYRHFDGQGQFGYAGVHGGSAAPIDQDSRGFFAANRQFRRDEISDGLGHTLQLVEIRPSSRLSFGWLAGNQSTLRSTGVPLPSLSELSQIQNGSYGNQPMPSESGDGYGWYLEPAVNDYEIAEQRMTDQLASAKPGSAIETTKLSARLSEASRAVISELVNEYAEKAAHEKEDLEIANREAGADDDGWEDESSGDFYPWDGRWGPQQSLYHPDLPRPPLTIGLLGEAASAPLPAGSFHSAGLINAVFASGQLVTISNTIDTKLYSQLGIRNDSQPLSPGLPR